LLDYSILAWPAITISFCSKETLTKLLEKLATLDEDIISRIEFEYFKAYPSIIKRLCSHGLSPWISVIVNEKRVAIGEEFNELCRRVAEKENY
jgi:hypothetical protein